MAESLSKICHLTSVHPRDDGRIYHKECVTLSQHGFKTFLIVADGKASQEQPVSVTSASSLRGNRLFRMIISPWLVAFAGLRTRSELFHFHDPELIFIGVLLKALGKRVIYDVHEDVPLQIISKSWIPRPYRGLVSKLFNFVEKFFSRFFDAIITATPAIAEKFKEVNDKVVTINNYPFLDQSQPLPPKIKERANQICYLGGISEVRGITNLIKAIEKCDAQLALAGSFSSTKYEETIRKMPGSRKVNFLGYISKKDVQATLHSSRVGIVTLLPIPNYIESQPTKLYEYMSAGVPAVASNFPLWKEVVEGHNCGICVNPQEPEEIARAINKLLNHPKIAEEMGENGRKAITQLYNWNIEAKKLIDLYKDILE